MSIFGTRFDTPEFLVGLFLGLFIYWMLRRLRPLLTLAFRWSASQFSTFRENISASTAEPYIQDLLFQLDNLHLAKPIFSLRQVILAPHILLDHPPTEPLNLDETENLYHRIMPTYADWNILSAIYQTPSMPIKQLLDSNINVLITGDFGSGKTTALAYLAFALLNEHPPSSNKNARLPIFIHAADIILPIKPKSEVFSVIIDACRAAASPGLSRFLPRYLRPHLREGRVLLLIDGIDELPEPEIATIAEWLSTFHNEFPQHQIIAAGPTRGYDGILKAGLQAMPIAPWNQREIERYLDGWARAWQTHIQPAMSSDQVAEIDPSLLNAWLRVSRPAYSPLEVTLRVWAAYVGDLAQPTLNKCMLAYQRRMLSPDEQNAAQSLALQWINGSKATIARDRIDRGIPLSDLLASGILSSRADNQIAFSNPSVGAHFAASALRRNEGTPIDLADDWQPRVMTLRYFAVQSDMVEYVSALVNRMDDPLSRALLAAGFWLRDAPAKARWRNHILSAIAVKMQDEHSPYGIRLRALQAVVHAEEKPAKALFEKMLNSQSAASRTLGALGIGGLKSSESIGALEQRLRSEEEEAVRFSICLSLAAIGTSESLIILGRLLLEGAAADQLIGAQALSSHLGEGVAMLAEAAAMKDVAIRRAAVYGLGRVQRDDITEQLKKIQIEDDQAIVRNAATEVLEQRINPAKMIRNRPERAADVEWLINFASQNSMGISAGKGVHEVLRRALLTGGQDQQIASLKTIASFGISDLLMDVFEALNSEEQEIKNVAFESLWMLEAGGVEISTEGIAIAAQTNSTKV